MEVFSTDCWFLTGQTASGKTDVALALAERLQAEIVAMDSMTLYRGMDIGTAKPTPSERQRVPHHLLDVLDPDQSASVDWYLHEAATVCTEIRQRGRRPLLVGGTPLYLKASLRGLFDGPPADQQLRSELEEQALARGSQALHQQLSEIDPAAAARIHTSDVRRLVRALEVYRLTGKPISVWQQQFQTPADPAPPIACLTRPRPELCERIDTRVVRMLEGGWIDEVRHLQQAFPSMSRQARQAVGYLEIADHLAGKLDYATMTEKIQARTRRFSRKQMTWFRHLQECVLFTTDQSEPTDLVVDRLAQFFQERSQQP